MLQPAQISVLRSKPDWTTSHARRLTPAFPKATVFAPRALRLHLPVWAVCCGCMTSRSGLVSSRQIQGLTTQSVHIRLLSNSHKSFSAPTGFVCVWAGSVAISGRLISLSRLYGDVEAQLAQTACSCLETSSPHSLYLVQSYACLGGSRQSSGAYYCGGGSTAKFEHNSRASRYLAPRRLHMILPTSIPLVLAFPVCSGRGALNLAVTAPR